jgi:hypothetical protein
MISPSAADALAAAAGGASAACASDPAPSVAQAVPASKIVLKTAFMP